MSEENWAKVEEIPSIVERARKAFNTDRSRSVDFRIQQLRRLRAFMTEKQSQVHFIYTFSIPSILIYLFRFSLHSIPI